MANRTLRGPDLGGEADLSLPAGLIGHPARTAMLLALLDGRALPMSVLAAEAGVASSTASEHLGRLTSAGLLQVVRQGRYRYYRIASAEVAEALEALARIAPPAPVRSLRAAGRAAELRYARSCYDHIAGLLGVALMRTLIDRGALTGGDGRHRLGSAGQDRLSGPGRDRDYQLTEPGRQLLAELGVVPVPGDRPLIRYCIDWTEQQHHLAGALGAALLIRFETLGWLERGERRVRRALRVTDLGARELADRLGLDVRQLAPAA